MASPNNGQITGLPRVLEPFPTTNVLRAGLSSPIREADYLRETLTTLDILPVEARPGHVLDLGDGVILRVLTISERGAILLLELNQFRELLPFGADPESQEI